MDRQKLQLVGMRMISSSRGILKSGSKMKFVLPWLNFWRSAVSCSLRKKTKITHIGNGFDFLGWNVRKYNGKLLIKPSKANISAHLDKLRALINANKATRQATLIGLLNPILRGWANYHSHVVAKKVFNQVDNAVWKCSGDGLYVATLARHPMGQRSVFQSTRARRWVFS